MGGPRGIWAMAAALGVVIAGCATHRVLDDTYVRETYVRERCLTGIEVDKTTRAEIVTRLGPSTASLADGKVAAYRLLLADSTAAPMTADEYQYRMGRDWASFLRRFKKDGPDALWQPPWTLYPDDTRERSYRREVLAKSCTLVAVTPSVAEERAIDLVGREAEYSLVLSFDDDGRLRDLSFRRVWP